MAQESHLRVVIDSRQALRDARAISTELQSIEKNGDYAAKSMNGASTAVREFAGYMAGIVTVGAAISKMDAYTGINNQLKLVTNSQVQLTGAMNETFAIAQRSRSSWESVTQVYQKLAMNAEAAGIAQKDIGRLTETISKGIALSGSSSEQAAAAIMQLGQSLGAGKLSGDEFNSVMENGYGVMQLLAKGMDVPIGQLKKLAGEGKLTSEVVTQALLKMSSTADAEFAKTDATIGQSLGMLSNAVTQFVGEAGKGSGAANLLSGSIQALAGNLDLIADTAVVGGVAYLTKTIVGQTIATQGAISASMQRRAANLAELETQIQLSGLEVQRTRQVAGLALTELHLARQELNNATTRQARAAATMRLTQAEVALALAEKQRTAATIADTAAQNANNAARSRGAMLLGLVGGPVGALTLGVAALAAIYMLATDNGEEANKMLEEQSKFAGMATTELEKLEGVQRRAANESLALTFETQTNQLKGLKQEFIEATEQILDHNKKNLEVQRIYNELRAGVLGVEEAFNRLNKIETIGKDDIANAANYRDKYRELNNTLAETKPKLEATATGIDSARLKAQQGAQAVFKLNAELEKLFNQGKGNIVEATVTKRLADLNYDDRLISIINKYVAVEGSINTATGKFYDEVKKRITEEYRAVLAQDKALDGRNEREKERLAILEQQGKVLRINSKVQALDKKYNISAREAAAGLPSGLVKSVIMQESRGDTYRNGKLLTSPAGAQGLGQFMPATAKQYKVNVTNEASSISGVIAYLSDLFKRFGGDVEKTIMAYNAGPGNVDSGKAYGFKETRNYRNKIKGYMAGQSGLSFDAEFTVNDFEKILGDRSKLLVEQKRREKQLLDDQNTLRGLYYDDWQKLEIDNQEKIKEINEKFASDPSERNRLLDLQKKAYEEDVGNWLKAQDQRYEAEQETNRQIIEARKAAFFAMSEPLGNMQAAGLNAMAQLNLSPLTYQRWQLNNQHQAGYSELADNLQASKDSINGNPDLSDTERYEQLTQAYEAYRQNKIALSQLYDQQELDLQNQQHAASLAGYGAMFGMMGSMLDAYGEKESTAYKLAFAMQKGFVLASAIMNAKGAIMAAWNDPTNVTIWQKMAGAAAVAVQTNDLMSAIQGVALTGFYSGGYTGPGGKYEPAGIVHKGEGVLSQEDMAAIGGPTGFMQLRQAIKGRGFSEGGLVSSYRSTDQMLAVQRETRQTNLVSSSSLPAPQINIEVINQASGVTVETEQISEREIRLIVRDEMPKAFEEQISNPNSRVSRAVSKNTTARRNR
ncbi:tape measure protein [Acinetobacter radioresistens]|uniref:tape measure protein n=1 Tax=Acinetobacter radioresistens TaxID=40216 RepID=UPI00200384EE|nr:tape measure protein [Acinetobacter radioresistens]MCK4087572.1 tape measure protein [Acinetobacter radioresistens]